MISNRKPTSNYLTPTIIKMESVSLVQLYKYLGTILNDKRTFDEYRRGIIQLVPEDGFPSLLSGVVGWIITHKPIQRINIGTDTGML